MQLVATSVTSFLSLIALVSTATAQPETISCAIFSTTDNLTKYVLADQFVFDTDAQSLDMRVRGSQMNWLFVTQKTEFLDDVFSVRIKDDGTIAAAGLRNSVPVAFRMSPIGTLILSYITDETTERIQWKCDRKHRIAGR